jgi:hypothetical protein
MPKGPTEPTPELPSLHHRRDFLDFSVILKLAFVNDSSPRWTRCQKIRRFRGPWNQRSNGSTLNYRPSGICTTKRARDKCACRRHLSGRSSRHVPILRRARPAITHGSHSSPRPGGGAIKSMRSTHVLHGKNEGSLSAGVHHADGTHPFNNQE